MPQNNMLPSFSKLVMNLKMDTNMAALKFWNLPTILFSSTTHNKLNIIINTSKIPVKSMLMQIKFAHKFLICSAECPLSKYESNRDYEVPEATHAAYGL
jgi:hypothetical protein